ncbi:5-(carboxyamino)imidazole ribonucleotide synthase [Acidisoma sp.]|uniref:5-(carboxyamino)imidazole ribonucleotide synthase n=1 Tax=Acidisoma sp. TaxID=1872115 RepID=UPI003AFFA74F
MLPPGRTIGIVGGGQLGRMSAIAAARLGYRAHILTEEAHGPAAQVSAGVTVGGYDDPEALRAFAAAVDVITFEFENVSAEGLDLLAGLRPVHPSPQILGISQDRLAEKTFLNAHGAATAPWAEVSDDASLDAAIARIGLPAILKTTRLGYDGRGQARVATRAEAVAAFARLEPKPLVLEGTVDFACEISVVVARGADGQMTSFDPVENQHAHGILDLTFAPARIPEETADRATALGRQVAEALGLVGLLAVEMFVDRDGSLRVNEIAPRPHNSGHWTIEACPVSQFEMHIRAVAGLPLPPAARHSDAVMKNLIGPDDVALWPEILATPGLIPHHYGKAEARPGRKMGHVTRLFPRGSLPGPFGIAAALGRLAPVEGCDLPDERP